MAEGLKITIDGHELRIPEDLDLNDVVALEADGFTLADMGSMTAVRFLVHRLLTRTDPDITLEEAGAKVPLSPFMDQADEEGPPPVPSSEPEVQSGTSGEHDSGNGSSGTAAVVEMHEATGRR